MDDLGRETQEVDGHAANVDAGALDTGGKCFTLYMRVNRSEVSLLRAPRGGVTTTTEYGKREGRGQRG